MNQAQWRKLTEWPLMIVAVAFLIAYAWEVIADLDGPAAAVAEIVINVTWLLFVVDYVVTLALARPKWRWFSTHLLDLAIVALPLLRPLRLLRLLTVLSILHRTTGAALRGRVIIYAAGASVLLVFVAALAVVDAERGQGTITSFWDGLWWAFVTVTTVGYGDLAPVTATGRAVAVAVMIGGIALIGVVTATLASWIVERIAVTDERSQSATRAEVRELREEITALRELMQGAARERETGRHPSG
jgi:voltage-gated potassium channel